MSDNNALNILSNQGIINCPTQLRLVGHFYKICIMMHGSMKVNRIYFPVFSRLVADKALSCSHRILYAFAEASLHKLRISEVLFVICVH